MHSCEQCGTTFTRKNNLTRHKNDRCKHSSTAKPSGTSPSYNVPVGIQKRPRSPEIPAYRGQTSRNGKFYDEMVQHELKNPKIQTLLDEIVNDGHILPPQAILKKIVPPPTTPTIVYSPVKKAPQLPTEVIAAVFPPTSEILLKPSSPPRTKGDIMGYSSDESTDSEVSIDITDIKAPKIKFLPTTVAELSKRFNELFIEFVRQKKYEHRNELVFLLDELLRQEAIGKDMSITH